MTMATKKDLSMETLICQSVVGERSVNVSILVHHPVGRGHRGGRGWEEDVTFTWANMMRDL